MSEEELKKEKEQEIIELDINSEELNKISKSAKERKFNMASDSDKFLYSETPPKKLKVFIDCYDFLDVLENNLQSSDSEISKKIKTFISKFGDEISKARELHFNFENTTSSLVKHYQVNEIAEFIKENQKKISNLINTCFPIGRRVQTYDPDQAAGVS